MLRGACRSARSAAWRARFGTAPVTRDVHVWSEEWRRAGLGATREAAGGTASLNRLMFVQCGFGCDQHGDRTGESGATKAAVRACRNAIEFNSIPAMVDHVPGGGHNMLIQLRLGVPTGYEVDLDTVAATFPYGRLLPIEMVEGGLTFSSGRVVAELGDQDDTAVVVNAAVSIGYHDPEMDRANARPSTPATQS